MMKNNATFFYACILVLGDFLAVLSAFALAYILRVKVDHRPLVVAIPPLVYIRAFLSVLPFWIIVHALIGLYSPSIYYRRLTEFGRLIVGSFLGILVVIGYDFVVSDELFPARLVPIYALILSLGFLIVFRTLARSLKQAMFGLERGISNVLIIGDTAATSAVAVEMASPRKSGLRVIATVGKQLQDVAHFSNFELAIEQLKRPIHSIIQTELYRDQLKNNTILQYAHTNHISYRFVPGNSDLFVGNIAVELFAGMPVVAVHQTALVGWGRIAKRIFDLVASTVILFFIWPFMLFLCLLQKLADPKGAIFFRQVRLTRFNQEFLVFKFRTLKNKYNGLLPEEGFTLMGKPHLIQKFRDNGDYLANDPRLTALGRVLRATSIDELPQLFNVLQGDISLVGPRALVPRELNTYAKKHSILSVKSGLTGLAQVSGRKSISFEERRKLDVYYVQNWSFWLDIVILLKTLKAIVSGAGAK